MFNWVNEKFKDLIIIVQKIKDNEAGNSNIPKIRCKTFAFNENMNALNLIRTSPHAVHITILDKNLKKGL